MKVRYVFPPWVASSDDKLSASSASSGCVLCASIYYVNKRRFCDSVGFTFVVTCRDCYSLNSGSVVRERVSVYTPFCTRSPGPYVAYIGGSSSGKGCTLLPHVIACIEVQKSWYIMLCTEGQLRGVSRKKKKQFGSVK